MSGSSRQRIGTRSHKNKREKKVGGRTFAVSSKSRGSLERPPVAVSDTDTLLLYRHPLKSIVILSV